MLLKRIRNSGRDLIAGKLLDFITDQEKHDVSCFFATGGAFSVRHKASANFIGLEGVYIPWECGNMDLQLRDLD